MSDDQNAGGPLKVLEVIGIVIGVVAAFCNRECNI